jgi:hypothetical protein
VTAGNIMMLLALVSLSEVARWLGCPACETAADASTKVSAPMDPSAMLFLILPPCGSAAHGAGWLQPISLTGAPTPAHFIVSIDLTANLDPAQVTPSPAADESLAIPPPA